MPREIDAALVRLVKMLASLPPPPGLIAGYYLSNGHLYPHSPYTEAEVKAIVSGFVKTQARLTPAVQECYRNAQRLAVKGGLGYAEGYAFTGMGQPFLHGWAVCNGKPVDVTLRRGNDQTTNDPVKLLERASKNLARVAYYGVEFSSDDILSVWADELAIRAIAIDPSRLRRNPGRRTRLRQ
jgi:hypothetical protein